MAALARFGLAARGFVYIVVGWLAIQIARGHGKHQANSRGAFAEIARQSYGSTLLWILGFGLAAYAIWRLSEAAFGTAADGRKAGPRVQSLLSGIVYAVLSATTFSFIAGAAKQNQSQQQVNLTARVMKHTYGRELVGVVGVVIVIVGLVMIVQGVLRKFEKQLRMDQLTGAIRTGVVRLGTVGTIARGIVFAIVGALVVEAAVTFNAGKSTGLDGALRTLANRPYGPGLLGALAVGLIAFGLFGVAESRWAKT
ncbi:MAG: DUF1206 domain-containing protein [Mycobacteriales bacterium]